MVTSGGQAELGRAMGGYVNMITKSGTNSLHADLYGYFRNQRFNAANPLSNRRPHGPPTLRSRPATRVAEGTATGTEAPGKTTMMMLRAIVRNRV